MTKQQKTALNMAKFIQERVCSCWKSSTSWILTMKRIGVKGFMKMLNVFTAVF